VNSGKALAMLRDRVTGDLTGLELSVDAIPIRRRQLHQSTRTDGRTDGRLVPMTAAAVATDA